MNEIKVFAEVSLVLKQTPEFEKWLWKSCFKWNCIEKGNGKIDKSEMRERSLRMIWSRPDISGKVG